MSISFGSSIGSLKAQRQLGKVSAEVSTVFERLSSGQRINKASDDAAGLSVVSSLQTDRRVFTQGIRNYNDGISLLNVADGAIEQLSTIVIRLKELAEQAANGIYGVNQRKALDAEAQDLSREYFRIERTTTFNGRGVFFAEFGELRLQGGYGTTGGIQSGLGGAIGTGSFGADTSYTEVGTNVSTAISLGDLNGDGILDLVDAGYGIARVRLGTGSGTFGAATSYTSGGYDISLGDLNGDGILDLVGGEGGTATVRLGTGSGTFGADTSYTMTGGVNALSLGDLNGDGILDLVTTNGATNVRLGSGNGTFGAAVSYSTASNNTYDLSLGDLNGDGVLDLVTVGYSSDGFTNVRLGRGDGTFGAAATYSGGATNGLGWLSLGDLNGDGVLDLVTSGYGSGVRLGRGDGTFGTQTALSIFGDTSLGDLNGDGILDLVTAQNGTEVRLGTGSGAFGPGVYYTSGGSFYSRAATLGDLNGDGVLDIAAAGYDGGFNSSATTRLSQVVSGVSPLLSFKLTSRADALQALSQFDQARNRLSTQRGIIGAFQSRITVAGNVLQASAENYAAAAGRIKDADVADESSKLVRTQILQQAASAVLAQANQQPSLALQLIK